MLSSFLDDHTDAAGFEITYVDDGTERTQLCHSVSLHAVTLERPSAAPALQCTPLAPDSDQFTVRVDAIELLSVVEPHRTCTRRAQRHLPRRQPGSAGSPMRIQRRSVSHRFSLFWTAKTLICSGRRTQSRHFVGWRQCAQRTVRRRFLLRSLLARDELPARADVLATLRAIGDADPGAIAPLTDELVPYLQSNIVSVRREATRCIAAIAEEDPDDVDAVPALATIVEDDADGLQYAVYALSRITREYPEEVKPVAETLGEVTLRDSLSDSVRLNATAGLGRIVGEYPSIAVEIVDDVATLFDADNPKLRNNAIGLIGDVAIVHTDVVEPYTEEITALLTVEDTYTRINASGALSRVAEDFPDSVEHVTPTFVELLSDENPLVRENACWALGHLCARDATSALEDRAHDDDNADVRTRASWALAQINE